MPLRVARTFGPIMVPSRRPPTGTESTVKDVEMAYDAWATGAAIRARPHTGGTGSSATERGR